MVPKILFIVDLTLQQKVICVEGQYLEDPLHARELRQPAHRSGHTACPKKWSGTAPLANSKIDIYVIAMTFMFNPVSSANMPFLEEASTSFIHSKVPKVMKQPRMR